MTRRGKHIQEGFAGVLHVNFQYADCFVESLRRGGTDTDTAALSAVQRDPGSLERSERAFKRAV